MNDTRLQLHYALQSAAGVGRTLLPKRPDDSHGSFMWDHATGALVQDLVDGEYRAGLRLCDMTLLLLDRQNRVQAKYPLEGRTLDDAFRFFEERAGRMLERPCEALPPHPVADGAKFMTAECDLDAFAAMYATAAAVLERFRDKHPNAGPVLVWPHHFDMATLLTRGEGSTIGIGFVPGDADISEPYWYVYPWPEPKPLPPPLSVGEWFTNGWVGAVLHETRDAEKIERFIEEAVAALP
jgi:hypothetical protein